MIKNVVFDFGQVLVHFEPEYMVGKYVSNKDDVKLVASVLFDRLYWDRLDEGTISDEEVVRLSKERLPERLHEAVEKAYYNWLYNIPEIEGMRRIVERLKEKGTPVFLLSNISTYFASHKDEIPILELIDNCIFSAVCGKTKPTQEMFEYMLCEYNIKRSETLFVDDSQKNIDGAKSVGINTYLFDGNAKNLEKFLVSQNLF